MRPNIKAKILVVITFLSDSGRRVPNCFDFTIGYSPVMEFPAGVWKLKPWHADVSA